MIVYILMKDYFSNIGYRDKILPNKIILLHIYGFLNEDQRIGEVVDSFEHCVSSHPFWTSSSLDVPAGITQEEGHTGFLIHLSSAVRALIFVATRIQPFLSLVDREVEFCVLTN